ncbi:phage tail tape measure protein [Sodalis sp. RH16]|uniref:phage tail tape measure protein n=1 Tax=Sodalis sp. RH16 TaxID=3394331 RepID=UPI0039B463CC
MPQETGSLIIKVTQDGVAKAADALGNLTAASVAAENAAGSLASEMATTNTVSRTAAAGVDLYTRQTAQMSRSTAVASKSINGVTGDLAAQQAAMASLLGKIDPVVGAYGRLDEMEKQLKGFSVAGLIGGEDLDIYTAKIDELRTKLEQAAFAATAAGQAQAKAAREAAAADKAAETAKTSLIEKLREQVATFGMSQAAMLEYQAAQLGVSKTAGALISQLTELQEKQHQEAEAAKAAAQAQKEAEAADRQAAASKAAFIARLQDQVATYGLSKSALMEYKAAQLGITEEAAPLIASIQAQEAAEAKAADQRSAAAIAARGLRDAIKQMEAEERQAAAATAAAAAEEAKAQAVKDNFVQGLREQTETMGLTTSQLLEYKAAQLGVTAEAAPYIQKLTQQDGTVKAATLSSKQYAQALRYLPMQITDVVTSLASGMPVWLIAIQQGGQIKDSFGGIGNAAKALISFINPVTLGLGSVATVAVAVALAYKQGSDETTAFNNAITLTGGYAGKTSGQLEDMAKSISSSFGTTSASAKALTAALSTGAFSGDTLQEIGKTAVAMQITTGRAIDDTIADFKKLSDDPLQGSVALNNQYHYLTQAVYDQIYALQQQGNTQAAQKVAEDAYASAMQSRASSIHDNLGLIESGWQAVWNTAKGAWDAMLGVGREKSLSDLLADAQKAASGQSGKLTYTGGPQAQGNVTILQKALDLQTDTVAVQAKGQQAQDKAIDSQAKLNALLQQTATNAQIRAQKQKELTDLLASGAKPQNGMTEAQARQDINEKYKDPAVPKTKAVTDNQATRMLLEMQGQEASLQGQVESESKLGTWEQKRLAFIQLIADLQGKTILTADQKSLLANQSALEVEFDKLTALEKQAKQQQDIIKLQERAAQLNDTMASAYSNAGDQYARQLNAYGKGDIEQQRTNDTSSIYREYQRYQEQLDKGTPADALNSDAYKKETANIKAQLDARLKQQSDYYAQLDALQSDWTNGATSAYQNYIDSAKDIAGQTKTAFTDAFSGMEDALVSFVTTGKLNFSSFATSVLNDLARIAVKSAESSFLQGVVSIASGLFGGAASSSGANAGTAISSSANQSLSLNAKGGVYDSPSLSAYSGRVVDRPTLFAFAAGGGVMGEAGPEAILPLSRGSDGSLGVRAKRGSAATVAFAPHIEMNIDQRGNTNDQQQQNNNALLKGLNGLVDAKLAKFKMEMQRPGFNN